MPKIAFRKRDISSTGCSSHYTCIATIIPRPAGGEGEEICPPPLPDFLDSSEKQQISTRDFQYLLLHQFGVYHQDSRKIRSEIFKKMAF